MRRLSLAEESVTLWKRTDQLIRTDNAYRRLLLNTMPALTLNEMCDTRPGRMYVCSSQLSQKYYHQTLVYPDVWSWDGTLNTSTQINQPKAHESLFGLQQSTHSIRLRMCSICRDHTVIDRGGVWKNEILWAVTYLMWLCWQLGTRGKGKPIDLPFRNVFIRCMQGQWFYQ